MRIVHEYRQKAAQARRLAQVATDPAVLEQLEVMANDYDEMADQLLEEYAERRD